MWLKQILSILLVLFSAVIIQTIQINGNLRMVHIYSDEQGLHHVYFTEPKAGETPKFLGERIFKDGQVVLDTYKND